MGAPRPGHRLSCRCRPRPPRSDAPVLVRAALEAMGGEARWRALEGVRVEGIGHEFMLEQSERFEGPWLVRYEQFSELRDLREGRVRRTQSMRFSQVPAFRDAALILADGVAAMQGRAADYYVRVHAGGKSHLLRETMSALEKRLDPRRFFRVHRSAIVNLERVRELQAWFRGQHLVILRDGTQITLSRRRRERLQALLGHSL